MKPNSLFDRTRKKRMVVFFTSIAIFSVITLIILSLTLINSNQSIHIFQGNSRDIANLENFEVETLRLQVATYKQLKELDTDFSDLLLRRALLENQLSLIQGGNESELDQKKKIISEYLEQYDELITDLMASPDQATFEELSPDIIAVIDKIALESVRLYDQGETIFFSTTSTFLNAQRSSQVILLIMGALVIVLSVSMGIMSSRSATTEIIEANQKLEFEAQERKQIAEDLQSSEERFRLIVQSIPVLINANDDSNNFIFWNHECEKVTGYQAEEVINNQKIWEALYPDPNYLEYLQHDWDSSNDKARNFVRTLVTKDGERRVISWKNMSAHFDIPGWKTWSMGTDITEQIHFQSELKDREQKYETLFNSMINVFSLYELIRDDDGIPYDFRFLEVNPAFERLNRGKKDEVIGKTFREFTGDLDQNYLDTCTRVVETGIPESFNYYSNFTNRHWEISVFKIEENKFATIALDITEQEKSKTSLHYASDIEHLISNTSSLMIKSNLEDIEQNIHHVFKKCADFFKIDRIFLFMLAEENNHYNLINEWKQEKLISIPRKTIPLKNYNPDAEWVQPFKRFGDIFVSENLSDLPEKGRSTKEFHENMGSKSMVSIPLAIAGKDIGFINISSTQTRQWDDALLSATQTIGEIIANSVERLKHLQEIARSENRYRGIVEDQVEFITRFLADGTLTFVNKAYCEFMGKLPEELLGESFLKFVPQEKHEEILSTLRPITDENQGTVQQVNKNLNFQGEYRWVRWANRGIFDDQGNLIEYQSSGLDITEQMKAQEELEEYKTRLEDLILKRTAALEKEILQHQKTVEAYKVARDASESANRAKSTFLANMSHELRTPLNAILGYAQLMRRDSAIHENHRNNIDIMIRSGEHLLMLINDVLQFSKIEAGKVEVEPNTFSLFGLLEDLHTMFDLRAKGKNLSFTIRKSGNTPDIITTDQSKLNQILMNLLSNAIKFTVEGSVDLWVNTRPSMKKEKEVLINFIVSDTGPGIDPQDIDVIFEPFLQSSLGQLYREGTGLGLPIGREFARLLGGSLDLDPLSSKGARFILELPAELSTKGEIQSLFENPLIIGVQPDQGIFRILIAEDEEINRELLIHTFEDISQSENTDLQIETVTNGAEAVEKWRDWDPDLIFMDMRMPVMDGFNATRAIKTSDRQVRTKIIALTASAFEDERHQMVTAGCDDLIIKPYQEIELFRALEKHLGINFIYMDRDENPETQKKGQKTVQSTVRQESCFGGLSREIVHKKLKNVSFDEIQYLKYILTTFNTQAIIEFGEKLENVDTDLSDYIIDCAIQYDYETLIVIVDQLVKASDQ